MKKLVILFIFISHFAFGQNRTITLPGGGSPELKVGADFSLINDSLKLAGWVNPKDLTAAGNGVTNDLAAILAAVATGKNIAICDTFLINGTSGVAALITLNAGQRMEAFGVGIIKSTTDARWIRVGQNCVVKNIIFQGSGSKAITTLEYQTAIYGSGISATGVLIEGNTFENVGGNSSINGGAIVIESIINGATEGLRIHNNRINNCGYGLVADVRAEYILATGNVVDSCKVGVYSAAGNFNPSGFTIQNCDVGFELLGGTNDGHCVATGGTINHNTINVKATNITAGYVFKGVMMYAGNLEFTNCNGIRIDGDVSTGTVTLTNNTNMYRSGKWQIMATNLVSGENFTELNVVRTVAGTPVTSDRQANADTTYKKGPLYHDGSLPVITPNSTTMVMVEDTSTNQWNYVTVASLGVGGAVSSIIGTTNQIIASGPTGAVTLSTPQNIHTTAIPQFLSLNLVGNDTYSDGLNISGEINGPAIEITNTSDGTVDAPIIIASIGGTIKEKTTGNHAYIVNTEFITPAVTGAGATVGDSYVVKIGAAMSATVTGQNYSLLVDGHARFNGDVYLNNTKLYGYLAHYSDQTGTTYTLLSSDAGKIVTFNNASNITLTVPTGLPVGFNCTIVQLGAGEVTFTASGTTILNRQSFTQTAGQYAVASIVSYSTNSFITGGDMQ